MIIGITGRKRSGKNTVADMLEYIILARDLKVKPTYDGYIGYCTPDEKFRSLNRSSYTGFAMARGLKSAWEQVAFADSVRAVTATIADIWSSDLVDESTKTTQIPDYLNNLFKDGRKDHTYRELLQYIGTDVFRKLDGDIWVNILFNRLNPDNNYIITDVRFYNEAKAITDRSSDNVIIKVVRPGSPMDNHTSELGVNFVNAHYVIVNDGSLEDLFESVKSVVEKMRSVDEDYEHISRPIEHGVNPDV